MTRTAWAVGALVAALAAGGASAQDPAARRSGRFDAAVYAGGAYSTRWFSFPGAGGEEQSYGLGYAPVFGASGTVWLVPSLGVRAHGAVMPSNLPDSDGDEFEDESFGVTTWLYDLSLAYRPFIHRRGVGDWLASTYVYVGAGGVTTDVSGPGAPDCAPQYPPITGVCLPVDPGPASVGAGTFGVGVDAYPMSRRVALFGEVAAHGYASPAHVAEGGTGSDAFAVTGRVVGGVRVKLGMAAEPVRRISPPPVRPDPLLPPRDTLRPAPVREAWACVRRDGGLVRVRGVLGAAGDTLVDGRPLRDAHPDTAGSAPGRAWFPGGTLRLGDAGYLAFGLSRALAPGDAVRVGTWDGVEVYAAPDAGAQPEVVYVPVRPGCEFQPFRRADEVRRVRG
jgi:hypothetical protein